MSETFVSVQGESSWSGLVCFFVRLSGCNLRCRYCDTTYAYDNGEEVEVSGIVAARMSSGAAIAEVTGGEPLLQPGFVELASAMRKRSGKPVLVETNGSQDIAAVPGGVITIMDIKCPASGECDAMDLSNIGRLRPCDETKFVISDRADYDWAAALVAERNIASLCNAVFFSPAAGTLDGRELAEWLVADALPVRLQIQLHRSLGIK